MSLFPRKLNISSLLARKSILLLGPRGTGKSTLVAQQLPDAKVYDLLEADTFSSLLRHPSLLREQNPDPSKILVIDEVQKLPSLLDEVQRLIQKFEYRFLLTGSSARKLKRGAANLLGGRAWESQLFPLSYCEIPNFDLLTYLNSGGLPYVYGSKEVREDLNSYIGTYLKEEIQAESATRNLKAFAEFLDLAALSNGQEVNFESMASDCGVSPSTLKSYLQILEDTLLGFSLRGFTKTRKRKATSRAKHYFFDIGVVNQLCRRGSIQLKSELFGLAFEQFIIQEVRAFCGYTRIFEPLCYWRSTSQFEVDLLIGQRWAIEIKGTSLVVGKHLKGLRALKEEGLVEKFGIVSQDSEVRLTEDGIHIWPWEYFLKNLWEGKIL